MQKNLEKSLAQPNLTVWIGSKHTEESHLIKKRKLDWLILKKVAIESEEKAERISHVQDQ